MMPREIIAKSFKNKPFSLKNAEELGITRYEISKLITQGKVEKLTHGIYVLLKGDASIAEQFKIATVLIGGPSAICLLSALEYYDLTDIISKEIWIMVSANKRTRQRGIRLFRAAHMNLDIGVLKTNDFAITSIERTLVDSLTHQRQISINIAIEALRRAIHLKKTTLSKVVDIANKLGVLRRIQSYIEALV